jgi:hypothetical protein
LGVDPKEFRGEFTSTPLDRETTVPTARTHLLQLGVALQRHAVRSHDETLSRCVEIDAPTDTGKLIDDV